MAIYVRAKYTDQRDEDGYRVLDFVRLSLRKTDDAPELRIPAQIWHNSLDLLLGPLTFVYSWMHLHPLPMPHLLVEPISPAILRLGCESYPSTRYWLSCPFVSDDKLLVTMWDLDGFYDAWQRGVYDTRAPNRSEQVRRLSA